MAEYKIDRVKPTSNRRRWEHWREIGIAVKIVDGKPVTMTKQELDEYTDRLIWYKEHPGQDPTVLVRPIPPEPYSNTCPKCPTSPGGWCGDHAIGGRMFMPLPDEDQEPSDGVPKE